MRKLMWFTIGFAAACAVGAYWISGIWLLLLSLLCACFALLTLIGTSAKSKITRMLFWGSAAAFLWFCLFNWVYLSDAKSLDGETVTTAIEITGHHTKTDWGISADGRIKAEGKPYKIRVYSNYLTALTPGDVVESDVRLRVSVFGQQEDTYHSANGTYLLGYLPEEAVVIQAEEVPLRYYPAVIKERITTLMNRLFPEDTLAFSRALLLGDRSLLDYKTNTDLSFSGIRHVVAVSGLHVSILFSVLFAVFGYRRVVTPVIGWIVLLLFAGITGFTPSVVRACIMHSLMLGALMLQKEYDAPTALACAILVMLTVNPMAVTSVGLQLSAGCVIGILLFSRRIQEFLLNSKLLGKPSSKTRFGRIKRSIAGTVSVTLSTLITTTPLCALYFGTISLIGVLTNLLTLWVVTIIFCGLLAACVAGAMYLPLGKGIAWLISWPIRYVLLTAEVLASFPLAAVFTSSIYIVIWIVFCYVLLIVFWLSKKKQPWTMALCMIMGLCLSVFASWFEPRLDDYRFSVLNVGQGQCILVQQNGKNYMIDCGGDSDEIAADAAVHLLLSQGIRKLDGVITTHFDSDHAGGVQNLLSRIPADMLYFSQSDEATPICQRLTSAYPDKICWIQPDTSVIIENSGLTIYSGNNSASDNESSLCVLFQSGNCDILITGDRSAAGERKLMEQTTLPDLEVLVVGHHGSKDATGLELLAATRPEVAIISVSETNFYSHPAAEVLERLALFNCRVLCTDEKGTIVIRG